jgi:hypothetical protein
MNTSNQNIEGFSDEDLYTELLKELYEFKEEFSKLPS